MTVHKNRRKILKLLGITPVVLLNPLLARSQIKSRIVIIGAGFGGATCARYLKNLAPEFDITLVEKNNLIYTCPFSNTVIAGLNNINFIKQNLKGLKAAGINVINAFVKTVHTKDKIVKLDDGSSILYDRLVISPGIDFKLNEIEGYNEDVFNKMPHAWKAGIQTNILRKQLEEMDDGGVVLISIPKNPYRCPPGPYERASLIAHYLKFKKPRSKIILFDEKDKFSKQSLFTSGWKDLYGEMIEWIPFSEKGNLMRADPLTMTLHSEFLSQKADVINVIPPQRANNLTYEIGLTDGGDWCIVDQTTFESTLIPYIHILGDSSKAGEMPKSGFSAASQAKTCAHSIFALQYQLPLPNPSLINTCYSLLAPDYGISVAAIYHIENGGLLKAIKGAGGLSPSDENLEFRRLEADYARGWYQNFSKEIYG